MNILALNCGSSSIKYKIFNWEKNTVLGSGVVERIGIAGAFIRHELPGKEPHIQNKECPNHEEAIKLIANIITDIDHGIFKDLNEINAVGHRVVHGGEKFKSSVLINAEVLQAIIEVQDLAPLHNPPNILGIEAAKNLMPNVPQIAVFDTAFHQTMPEMAYLYAVPYEWYGMYGVRRYGFHGTSHLYVSRRAAVMLGKKPKDVNLITMHIGNGTSITAVKNGVSVDTSMGLTPLEGAVMGTRCGDIDPAIILFMIEKEGFYVEEIDSILNKKSGLLGITGKYMDRRDIEKAAKQGDARCRLAIDIEAYRLRKYIGSYCAALGRVDAIVLTAGAGELDWELREKVLTGLDNLGIKLDRSKNKSSVNREESDISDVSSKIKILVVPTDEERVFIEDVVAILKGKYDIHTRFTYSFEAAGYKRSK